MQTRLSLTFERPENSFEAIVHIWTRSQCCKIMTGAPAVGYKNLLKTTLDMWIGNILAQRNLSIHLVLFKEQQGKKTNDPKTSFIEKIKSL